MKLQINGIRVSQQTYKCNKSNQVFLIGPGEKYVYICKTQQGKGAESSDLLQRGDSSAPLGQSGVLSHTVVRLMHRLWPGHCHCQLGQRKGGVGQSLSSLRSRQSLSPSQIQLRSTQLPLSQRKKEEGQVRGAQAWCSSLPSSQSGWPSHSQLDGRQLPSDWHWNSLSWWHMPGGLVAEMQSGHRSAG